MVSNTLMGQLIIGFLLFMIYFILNMWAAVTNTFLSATVRLQEDRDQYVVEEGYIGLSATQCI